MSVAVTWCDYTVVGCCSSQHRLPCDHGSKRWRYIGKKVARLERLVLSFACSASSSWYVPGTGNLLTSSGIMYWLHWSLHGSRWQKKLEKYYIFFVIHSMNGTKYTWYGSIPYNAFHWRAAQQVTATRDWKTMENIILSYMILLGFAQHQPHSLVCGNCSAIELSLFARWSAWHPPQELQTLQLGLQKVLIVLAI